MKQLFVIVSRGINDSVKTVVVDDFVEACATQLGILTGVSADIAKVTLKSEDIETVKDNLEKYGRDRLANDEEEVYIFLMPKRDKMR